MSLPTPYQSFIALSRYSRYLPDKKRRETWLETVRRYVDFFESKYDFFPSTDVFGAIYDLEVMPSMRALMTAGKALERDNVAGYNCAYLVVDDPRAFDEALYISACGTGVGFSVERQYINKLPEVAEEFFPTDTVIKVADSKIGWAHSLRELISLLYAGHIPTWDMSDIRPAGAPLKTFGGRASGPDPLDDLFRFTVELFKKAAGRKLKSIECHDLMTKIADVIVSGGVRRSAMISLSNLSDERMRNAKNGQWWLEYPHRALANNSTAYTEKPEIGAFMQEWFALYESKAGERGIFNRNTVKRKAKASGRRKPDYDFGANPCVEIGLRPNQFCNLTEVVIRAEDTLEKILEKIRLATIMGTFQSTLTNFRYLRTIWKKNCEEERLLGVSLTGIMDHPVLSGQQGNEVLIQWLTKMKEYAIEVNKEWAERLGINQSAAITCTKPSGTVSQLVCCASGIHGNFDHYFIRAVRNDKKDPLSQFMIDKGIPHEEDVMKNSNWVFNFPQKAPEGARLATDLTAIEQLEHYLIYTKYWAEHSVSITVYVREHEWLEVAAWVYKHFDELNGLSFLPYVDTVYKQAPYQSISKEVYDKLISTFPVVDFSEFKVNEYEDNTVGARLLACAGGVCSLE